MDGFNCHSNRHFSRDCNQPQQFSRCAVCNLVCASSNSHKNWCTNRDFISRMLQPGVTVFKTKIIAEIGWNIFSHSIWIKKNRPKPVLVWQIVRKHEAIRAECQQTGNQLTIETLSVLVHFVSKMINLRKGWTWNRNRLNLLIYFLRFFLKLCR